MRPPPTTSGSRSRCCGTRDNKVLTRQTTYVAPLARAPLGGINNAVINVSVIDIGAGMNAPAAGATVNLGTGPSAPRSDTADVTGAVTFAASDAERRQATTTSPLRWPAYETLPEDLPGAHRQPERTSRWVPARRGNVDPHLQAGPDRPPRQGRSRRALPRSRRTSRSARRARRRPSRSRAARNGDSLGAESIIPGLEYTVTARTSGATPLCSVPETRYVPDAGYPTVTDVDIRPHLQPCPVGTIQATVTWAGAPVPNATVDILGGPNNVSIPGLIADVNGP